MTGSAKQSSFREATRKMDCFVARAPLRKRFAFVAGNDRGWDCGDLPDRLNPRVHGTSDAKILVEQAVYAHPTCSIDSTKLPDGQITQKSVKPLLQKYSDFPKSQISLYHSHPVPLRGAFRERHGTSERDAMDAGSALT